MQDVIYKVTSKRVVKLEREKGFLDMKTYFLELSTNTKIPAWKLNQMIVTPDGLCIFTHDEKIAEVYKDGLATYEKRWGKLIWQTDK